VPTDDRHQFSVEAAACHAVAGEGRVSAAIQDAQAARLPLQLVIQSADSQFTARGGLETLVHQILDQCVVENYLNPVVLETKYTKLVSRVENQ
jgi:hypothetical protein